MSVDDPGWREFPVLREFFLQWRVARSASGSGTFQQPFRRSWEALLESAGLLSAEARREADHDARTLAHARLIELKFVRYRPYQIERVTLPLDAEPRLRALFADELPEKPGPRFDPAAVEWEPELGFLRAVRIGVSGEDLLKLNAFFANAGRHRVAVPVKERSLEIFGDEKRLDALRCTTLFDDNRLALAQLRCFPVAEPLGWKRGPRPAGPVLVIENASTWDSYCRWNAIHGTFSAVVYGCGNRFVDSVARVDDVFAEIGGQRPVVYFGDLDPQGLRIPQLANRRAGRLDLPSIEAHLWSYARLLELGRGKETRIVDNEPVPTVDFEWLGYLEEPVQRLFNSRSRLAQEHVGWEFLQIEGPE